MRPFLGIVPALAWAAYGDGDGWTFLEVLALALAPASIDAWVRLKVARIEAAGHVLAYEMRHGADGGDDDGE